MTPQIVLEGSIDTQSAERIERVLLLQLGTVTSRIASLKANVREGGERASLPYQCELHCVLKDGKKLSVSMINAGLHVCVADAAARLLREVRRHNQAHFRSAGNDSSSSAGSNSHSGIEARKSN